MILWLLVEFILLCVYIIYDVGCVRSSVMISDSRADSHRYSWLVLGALYTLNIILMSCVRISIYKLSLVIAGILNHSKNSNGRFRVAHVTINTVILYAVNIFYVVCYALLVYVVM